MLLNFSKIASFFHLVLGDIKINFSELLSSFYVRIYLIITLGINTLNWFLAHFINTKAASGNDLFILRYNVNFGISLLGEAKQVYLFPAVGLAVIFLNFFVILNFKTNNKFINHVVLAGALAANLFLLLVAAQIYSLNFKNTGLNQFFSL
jgi:hypothetical protein